MGRPRRLPDPVIEDAANDPRWVAATVKRMQGDLSATVGYFDAGRRVKRDVPMTLDGCQTLIDRACNAGFQESIEQRFGGVDAAEIFAAELEDRRERLDRAASTFTDWHGGWLRPPARMEDRFWKLAIRTGRVDLSRMVRPGGGNVGTA